MSAVLGLFNIFALIYVFRSLQLSATIWRERRQIKTPPLTRRNKYLASQASFFIAVPIGVLVHEFGHALATWLFGGRVVEFGYRAFWGYVIPEGSFSPTEEWFISLAGTLGSLLFGQVVWYLFRNHRNPTLRYFGLRTFRFQVFFSLVYYPVFTLLGFVGDWRTIYDFSATPLASALTALSHVGLLILFWRGDRNGWFEMVSHESLADEQAFQVLKAQVDLAPHDDVLQLQYIDSLRRGGAINTAKSQVKEFIKRNPNSGDGHLQLAALQSASKRQVPRSAIRSARKALSLGLSNPASSAYAHQILGKDFLDTGDGAQAVDHLSQAIALTPESPSNAKHRAQLFHWRSQAFRRQRQYEAAYQDVERAITLTQSDNGDGQAAAFYQGELEILKWHADRA